MDPKETLKSTRDFQNVFAHRQAAGDGLLVVFARQNGREESRLGLSISRKYGCAVKRNRWKRLVREGFRQVRKDLPENLDVVVVPGKRRHSDTLQEFEKSLKKLLRLVVKKLKMDIIERVSIQRDLE
ncbi:MAG: ribonuclease P protein component [Planctomycetia bacterium]|nr:ribonuclease P protein component [Planctomycetia bacterium]